MTTDAKRRYTETLSQLRLKEVMDRRPGQLVLRVTDGQHAGHRDVRVVGRRLTGGANPGNQLVLSHPTVSEIHFELWVTDEGATLRDLGSKNGTWVSAGVRVREASLSPQGTFGVGPFEIQLLAVEKVDIPVSTLGSFGRMYGRGTTMGELFSVLERLATLDLDVLLVGETGTGKQLIAEGLHTHSGRSGPMVVLDCGDLDESLASSALHGHRKGAFTGAVADRAGLLEQADGGTLFIDEVGELPLALQTKLLHALAESETRRIGDTAYTKFDTRVIAATHRDLVKMVGEGTFRKDLYFRLAQMKLDVPPLRARGSVDIHALADVFADRFGAKRDVSLQLSQSAYATLSAYHWPGNVRELENTIRYAAAWAQGEEITAQDLPPLDVLSEDASVAPVARATARATELEDALLFPFTEARAAFERIYVTRVLAESRGNKSETARRLDMSKSTLWDLLKRLEITPSAEAPSA